jgi:hypothetical protein
MRLACFSRSWRHRDANEGLGALLLHFIEEFTAVHLNTRIKGVRVLLQLMRTHESTHKMGSPSEVTSLTLEGLCNPTSQISLKSHNLIWLACLVSEGVHG